MRKRFFITGFLLSIAVGISILWWIQKDMNAQMNSPLSFAGQEELHLRAGTSLRALANELVERGWLPHPYYFIIEGRRTKAAESLKVGEYIVPHATTPNELLALLVQGRVKQYSITIPEGWSFLQILEQIRTNPTLIKTLSSDTPEKIMEQLGYAGTYAEGRVFPDTYFFPAGTSDRDFLVRAIKTGQQVLNEEWSQREEGLPYQSPYQALIMASIIEKETGRASERKTIAGVFVRRLRKNMKLQTDPTVIYAMAERFDGNIRRKDLSLDSPYNTYVYKGLPPTPIASPGRASIHAALHPAPGKSLYFVAKGDGSHYFSETLSEHNKAVAKYQLGKR